MTSAPQWGVTVLDCRHLWLAPVRKRAGDVREYLCDVAHGFGPTLSEDHSGSRSQVLGVLDESEETLGLVAGTQVFLVHRDNGGRLLGAPTVDCGGKNRVGQNNGALHCR